MSCSTATGADVTSCLTLLQVITKAGENQLLDLIQSHVEKTGSPKAKSLLADWPATLARFWQIVPPAEKNTPEVNPEVELAALFPAAVVAIAA